MPLPLLPTSGPVEPSLWRRVLETINNILTFQFDDSRRRTPAEVAAGVTPVNYAYPPGDVRRYGAVGDGVTDDTAAIQAAFNSGKAVFEASQTYLFSSQLAPPADTIIEANGATLKLGASIAGNTVAMKMGTGCRADVLRIQLPIGVAVDRALEIGSNCVICRVEVESADQIDNKTDNLDAAVRLVGDNITVGSIKVKNFDRATLIYNASGVEVDLVQVESYVLGLKVRESDFVGVQRVRAFTASANATTAPGNNGLLIEEVIDSQFPSVAVSNSGEHGVRIGGGFNGPSRNLQFGCISAWKPGQCGFKIFDPNFVTSKVTVGEVHVTDCAATSATGSNEDPVRIQNADDVTIGLVAAYAQDKGNCGNDGVYINGCQRVDIGHVTLFNPLSSGFNIRDNGDVSRQCRDINVGYFTLHGCSGDGIIVNSPTFDLRHINFHDGYMRDVAGDAVVITTSGGSGTGGVPDPCIFRFKAHGITGALFNTVSTAVGLNNLIETFNDSSGQRERFITLADDAATAIVPPRTEGLLALSQAGDITHSGLVAYDAAGTPSMVSLSTGGSATFAVRTSGGALTGTTGTDGDLTVSADAGLVYIENRTGAAVTVLVRFI